MKIGVFTNFAYPHIGGSEMVIENVARRLAEIYGHRIKVYSFNQKKVEEDRGIYRIPCQKGPRLISQINENDCVWVYSDSFFEYGTLVRDLEKIDPRLFVALVGMYKMTSDPKLYDICLQYKKKLCFIEHYWSKAIKRCRADGFLTRVIPNGVSLKEFADNQINFRQKYKVGGHILLNVSNYFYGKGQEHLPLICKKVKNSMGSNFTMVSIFHSIDYPFAESFRDRTKRGFEEMNIPHLFLRDIPREDVVAAFKEADVFVFPSLKEVSPLVILESRAAKLLWVATGVGDISEQSGGFLVPFKKFDQNGYGVMGQQQIDHFSSYVCQLIGRDDLGKQMENRGVYDLLSRDWSKIVDMYQEVFTS